MRRSHAMGRNYNSVGYASSVKLGPVTHTVLVALMITVLGLIYLTQATQATGYDYTLEEIDSKIADLSVQKTDLEVENAKLTSLQAIRDSSVAANMTQTTELEYAQQ
jgi:cell division protein FtsL